MVRRVLVVRSGAWALVLAMFVALCAPASAEDDEAASPARDGSPLVQSASSPADPDSAFDGGTSADGAEARVILAAHPGRDVVICLAGCGGGPKLVAVLEPRGAASISAHGLMLPTSAPLPAAGDRSTEVGAAAAPAGEPSRGDVICLAGCPGAVGQVVQRGARLTWVNPAGTDAVRKALAEIADRLAAEQNRPDLRNWVSAHARKLLGGGSEPLPAALAGLVQAATGLARETRP